MILDLNDKQVVARLRANAAELLPAWHRAGTEWANDLDGRMVKRMSGRSGNDGLNVRSGNLRRNVKHFSRIRSGAGFAAGVTIRAPYARIHEEGGEIKPIKAKALAIPVKNSPALTPAGVAKYASPRDYPGYLYLLKTDEGKLFLAEDIRRKGRGSTGHFDMRLVYQLVSRVRMPARLGLQKTGRERVPALEQALIDVTARLFARAA